MYKTVGQDMFNFIRFKKQIFGRFKGRMKYFKCLSYN